MVGSATAAGVAVRLGRSGGGRKGETAAASGELGGHRYRRASRASVFLFVVERSDPVSITSGLSHGCTCHGHPTIHPPLRHGRPVTSLLSRSAIGRPSAILQHIEQITGYQHSQRPTLCR